MGGGRFDNVSYAAYSTASTVDVNTGRRKGVYEVFTQREIHHDLDPKYIKIRESCDSEDNPQSRPVIIGLDVTGSMGFMANDIANHQLGDIMRDIIDNGVITDPHLMFMAIGDVKCDAAPLQVSQFEADIRIAQQLSQIYVEGGGGGNNSESYTLPWYFAAFHTKTDSFDKRGKKGIIITIGDEMPPSDLHIHDIKKTFGYNPQKDFTTEELYDIVHEKWDVFHIIVEQGSYARGCAKKVYDGWFSIIGNRAIRLADYTKLPSVIRAIIEVNEGRWPDEVIALDPENKKVLEAALYGFQDQ